MSPPPLGLVDAGALLTHRRFAGDEAAVIARAQQAGVAACIIPGTNETRSERAAAVARRFGGVAYSTAGVHPHDTGLCDVHTMGRLRTLAMAATFLIDFLYFEDTGNN